MDRERVMQWVAGYERAWRDGDLEAVGSLFSEEARYLPSPYEEPEIGLAAIRDFWLDDEGRTFSMTAEPVAVDGRDAVVRVDVHYEEPRHEYRNLWLLRFAADGRVETFEEWAYWPGKPSSSAMPTASEPS
jgi:ketosteroid isomerase-like protein